METLMPYGLKGEMLVSIDGVESGLACNCVCPHCKGQLIARKGNINVHHFAHYNNSDCGKGLESALHKISKELFKNRTHFVTPPLHYPEPKYEIYPEQKIPIDKIWFEKKLGGIIPDIIIESKGKKLLVEIVVTHTIDPEKYEKIKALNLATVIIFAGDALQSRYHKRDFGLERTTKLDEEIVTGSKFKQWVFNPRLSKINKILLEKYAKTKTVEGFKFTDHTGYEDYFWHVNDCPLSIRTWQSGARKGKSYAKHLDCSFCPYNLSGRNYKAFQCIGHIAKDLPKILRDLK